MTAPAAPANPFQEFLDRYAPDPVLYCEEVLGASPDKFQAAILCDIANGERRISMRSGHGVGKSTTLAWATCWHFDTRFPQKTVCTAPTSAQLFDALAAETLAWMRKRPAALLEYTDIKSDRIEHRHAPEESFVSYRTSRAETPEALAGIHSENVLLIVDEASGVPEQVFEAGIGSMSGHTATTILAGNPVRTSGLFFDTHHKLRGEWRTYHISCVDHPRVSADFVKQVRDTYGEDSNQFRVRVLGEFPKADDDTVIPFELAESALRRDVSPIRTETVWGVDCARFGSDRSALARRKGNALLCPVETRQGWDTMQVAGWVKNEWDATAAPDRPTEILVDVIGIGAGVVDRLRELNLPVRGINVSESPSTGEPYANLRAELWFKGREWLAKRDCTLAGDEGLVGELVAPKYKFTSSGKRQIESKEDMKKRGMRSPDKADAFLLTFAATAATLAGGGTRADWKTPLKRAIKGLL